MAPDQFEAAAELARALGVPRVIATLLISRGLADPDAARAFLQPSLDQLHDPRLMLGMQAAVERLRTALLAHEPILIYGDYDVDGTLAPVRGEPPPPAGGRGPAAGAGVRGAGGPPPRPAPPPPPPPPRPGGLR